jgi:hypothetical protein
MNQVIIPRNPFNWNHVAFVSHESVRIVSIFSDKVSLDTDRVQVAEHSAIGLCAQTTFVLEFVGFHSVTFGWNWGASFVTGKYDIALFKGSYDWFEQ